MDSLVLASRSPRRRDILNQLKIPFIVHEVDINEDDILEGGEFCKHIIPKVIELSKSKAEEAGKYYKNGLVLGVDTVVCLLNRVLGKPVDIDEAYRYLKQLSGNKHTVISGITVLNSANGKTRSLFSSTEVYFFKLSDREIKRYLEYNEWVDKAGGYAIQGMGASFIKKINGSFHNVMGLPVGELFILLKKFDYFSKESGEYRPVRRL